MIPVKGTALLTYIVSAATMAKQLINIQELAFSHIIEK
ncbi:hypothetical protein ASZ90_018216 [hydrocarbon metagenome]|uniref:Uncharacterized protein n=1 Tax=hydrocarbon metagenome TaxID=938273 RepID=A0A0W8E6W6_9ZZZZ